jgi:hypothetical protein
VLNDIARTISTKSGIEKMAKNNRGEMTIENTPEADTLSRVNYYNNNKNFPKKERSVQNSLQSIKGSDAQNSH